MPKRPSTPPPGPSRADRLHAIVAKVAPKAAAQHATDGTWPNTHPDPGRKRDEQTGELVLDAKGNEQAARHSGAPYVFETLENDSRRLLVRGDDGDVVAGVGATTEAAIAAVEQKLGLAKESK